MESVLFGEILALMSSLCAAFFSVTYNRVGQKWNVDSVAYVRMLVAFPVMILLCLLFDGGLPLGYSFRSYAFLALSGAIGFFLCDALLFRGFVYYGPRESQVVMNLVPVMNAILAFALFGEKLSLMKYLGILLTVAGIITMVFGEGGKTKEKKKVFSSGFFLVLGAAVLQTFSDLSAKAALESVPPVSTSTIRILFGLLSWMLWAPLMKRRPLKEFPIFEKQELLMPLFLITLFGPVGGTTCLMMALKNAPVGVVSVLKQLSPVLLIPFDVFFLKKRLSLLSVLGTLMSVVGVIVIFL